MMQGYISKHRQMSVERGKMVGEKNGPFLLGSKKFYDQPMQLSMQKGLKLCVALL